MIRSWLAALTLPFLAISPAFGCSCAPAGQASKYIKGASIAFVGKVVFTDDDGSHSFEQKTLVRFRVEEAFKGLTDTEKDVWVDPGSFTSCYAEYAVGERYLVFGNAGEQLPKDSPKPLPAAIDPKHPPTIYLAWECSGTRLIPDAPNRSISRDVEYLRKYRRKAEKELDRKKKSTVIVCQRLFVRHNDWDTQVAESS